jgi:possible diguanylate cyclase/phosphodiesterase (fragment)
MGDKERNKVIRFALLLASFICLLLFIFLTIFAWNSFFSLKPKEWKEWKESNEKYMLSEKKSLLFFSSYDTSSSIFAAELEGMESIINQSNIHLDTINMDFQHFGHDKDIEAFHTFVRTRMNNREKPYDGIMVGDDRALRFVMEAQEELFSGIPIIFFGIGDEELAKNASRNPKISGYYSPTRLKETLDLATSLQIGADTIMVLYDNTYLGNTAREEFFALQRSFSSYRFAGLNFSQMKKEDFFEAVEKLDEKSIVLYISTSLDEDGNYYPVNQSIKMVLSKANVPIYGYAMVENVKGFLGGRVMGIQQMAKNASLLMLDVLSGKKEVEKISYEEDSPGMLVVDNRVLSAYHIPKNRLPKNVYLEDSPKQWVQKYASFLMIAALPLVAVIMIAAYFVMSRLHSKKVLEELEEKNESLLLAKDDLEHKLSYDLLTELLNRQTALARLPEFIGDSKDYSCVLVDIDNLKELNESRGYDTGDLYLIAIANRLRRFEKDHGVILSRYGGDEFMIIFPQKSLHEDSPELAEILSIFRRAISVGEETVYMNASGGVASSIGGESPRTIVMYAGLAMSFAKRKGKNRLVFYSEELRYKKEKISQILKKVENAIQENSFYMVYQPQVDCKSRKVVGFESLMRIRNEDCSPDQFIPVAESYGYIVKLGKIAVEQVIRQLAKWKEEGHALCPISINFSSYQIYDDDFVEYLFYQLDRYEIPHEYVVLEITEGILFEESKQTKKIFNRLVEAGIQLHLDDFGTGYSSFSYLPYIPLNTVKMDKSLIDHFLPNNGDVIKNLIEIVHDLGKVVIVEGVEEEWQYEKLLEYRCDVIQGYLFGGPLQAGEIP